MAAILVGFGIVWLLEFRMGFWIPNHSTSKLLTTIQILHTFSIRTPTLMYSHTIFKLYSDQPLTLIFNKNIFTDFFNNSIFFQFNIYSFPVLEKNYVQLFCTFPLIPILSQSWNLITTPIGNCYSHQHHFHVIILTICNCIVITYSWPAVVAERSKATCNLSTDCSHWRTPVRIPLEAKNLYGRNLHPL